MEIHELTERQSTLDTGVYLPVDDGDVTQKIDYPRLAQAIIEQYTASSLGGSYRSIKTALDAIKTSVDGKVNTSDVVNNVVTTAEGKVLDARQGKTLNDSISTLNTNSTNTLGVNLSNGAVKYNSANSDANTITNVFSLGAGSNYPTNAMYYVWTLAYTSISTGNRRQIATPYLTTNGNPVYTRFYNGTSWSSWVEVTSSNTFVTVTVGNSGIMSIGNNSTRKTPHNMYLNFGINFSGALSAGSLLFTLPYTFNRTQYIIVNKNGNTTYFTNIAAGGGRCNSPFAFASGDHAYVVGVLSLY